MVCTSNSKGKNNKDNVRKFVKGLFVNILLKEIFRKLINKNLVQKTNNKELKRRMFHFI